MKTLVARDTSKRFEPQHNDCTLVLDGVTGFDKSQQQYTCSNPSLEPSLFGALDFSDLRLRRQ